jgi:hypothetical protein
MRVTLGGSGQRAHLTYCTSVHPSETEEDLRRVLAVEAPAVKAMVCPDEEFGVGLRLSAGVIRGFAAGGGGDALKAWLSESGLYVCTVNAFPFGAFAGEVVKDKVYLPDWRTDARVDYTLATAEILARATPCDLASISSVPGCYGAPAGGELAEISRQIGRTAAGLAAIEARTGKCIVLALEPEPGCMLARTTDAIGFFERGLLAEDSVVHVATLARVTRSAAESLLRRHVGVCVDACHAAVEYESPTEGLAALAAAGIRVPKVQLSAGLVVDRPDPERLARLFAFAEPIYLHHVVARGRDGVLRRYPDLPRAFEARGAIAELDESWRVHFHVPIFQRDLGVLASSQPFLIELLGALGRGALGAEPPHLEVETYSWSVLPAEHRSPSVTTDVARELRWARSILESGARTRPQNEARP